MLSHFEGHFEGQKGPIWNFVIYLDYNIPETMHAMTNVCMKHIIYKVIYDLLVYLVTFDLDYL